jgi:hypothetical protein
MLVLGPRREQSEERSSYQRFVEVLNQASRKGGPEFVHVFDKQATLTEAQVNGSQYDPGAGIPHRRRAGLFGGRGTRLHFAAIENAAMSSILLVNDHVGMSVPLASGGTKVVLIDDQLAATEILENLKQNPRGNVDPNYFGHIDEAIRIARS